MFISNWTPDEIIRKAKSASDWTPIDLLAYNISLVSRNATAFFGKDSLPLPNNNHPQLLTHPTTDDVTDKDAYRVLEYMDLVMTQVPGEESAAVDDFTMHLLLALGYAEMNSGTSVRTRKDIPFYICGEWKHAKADVCIIERHKNTIILLVQCSQDSEDKRYMEGDPRPQLVAKAIAAFQHNNHIRQQSGLEPLVKKVIPGITMIGTSPIFFKVNVSTDLLSCIEIGRPLCTPTIVEMHVPEIPSPPNRFSEGMRLLDNRSVILACFEAFKQFLIWLA